MNLCPVTLVVFTVVLEHVDDGWAWFVTFVLLSVKPLRELV